MANDVGLWPTEIARRYGLSLDMDGAGQSVGIVAASGGYLPSDLAAAAAAIGRPAAEVIDISVDGAVNAFGGDADADAELALDLQVLSALVPAARIVVYFTGDTQESLAHAIQQAVDDTVNSPSVLSISWGSAERYWPASSAGGAASQPSARDQVQAALGAARDHNMTVLAASGDLLASAGERDGAAHVIFPGSSPLVLSCGGTEPAPTPRAAEAEAVWNEGVTGTGGGISDIFDVPDYQRSIALPLSVNDGRRRRGVPDVAALASSSPGWQIVLGGETTSRAGTSAATPFWAALVVLANAVRGQPLGLVNTHLYANRLMCRPVAHGDNRIDGLGYDAGPDWNACCGLGVPAGGDIVAALAAMPIA
jgi:kumamolisin